MIAQGGSRSLGRPREGLTVWEEFMAVWANLLELLLREINVLEDFGHVAGISLLGLGRFRKPNECSGRVKEFGEAPGRLNGLGRVHGGLGKSSRTFTPRNKCSRRFRLCGWNCVIYTIRGSLYL